MQYSRENSVCAGPYWSAIITQEGKLVCWGDNAYRQCNIPPAVENEHVVAVSCGWYHVAALLYSGLVVCWGGNDSEQCDVPRATQAGQLIWISIGGFCQTILVFFEQRNGATIRWKFLMVNLQCHLSRFSVHRRITYFASNVG
jgi:alpha-tubulin suppressor-like RCC1 family protein